LWEKVKGEREKVKGERGKVKGEREKVKGERENTKHAPPFPDFCKKSYEPMEEDFSL